MLAKWRKRSNQINGIPISNRVKCKDSIRRGHCRPSSCSRNLVRRGAACVEFAFVAPFLLFLVFGSFEFSRMIMVQQSITNAAREGSRHASLVTTNNVADVEETVREQLKGTITGYSDDDTVRVSCTPNNMDGLASGTIIETTVEVDCDDVSWMSPMFFIDAKLSYTSTMKRE